MSRTSYGVVWAGIILVLILSILNCHGSPENPTRSELLQTVQHIQRLAEETQGELEQERLAHKGTSDALTMANHALDDTQKSFNTYRLAAEKEIARGNQAITERDHLLKKLHLAKWIMSALAVAAIAFLAMKIPLPLSLYLGGGTAMAAVSLIWMWL